MSKAVPGIEAVQRGDLGVVPRMSDLPHYLNRLVRVKFSDGSPWFEGTVIGFHAEPTLVVIDERGRERGVSTHLPIELVERRRDERRTP